MYFLAIFAYFLAYEQVRSGNTSVLLDIYYCKNGADRQKERNSKTCLKRPLKKKTKNGFQDRFSLMQISYSLSLRPLFCLFLSDRLRQVLLYVIQLQDDPDRHLNNRTHFSIDLSYLYSNFAEKIKEFMEKIVQDKLGWRVEGI